MNSKPMWNVFVKGRLVGIIEAWTVFYANQLAVEQYGSDSRITCRT